MTRRRRRSPLEQAADEFRDSMQRMADEHGSVAVTSVVDGKEVSLGSFEKGCGGMYGINLECVVRSVKVKTTKTDGVISRRCRLVLAHPFTVDIARSLGKDAFAVRQGLESNGVAKATLPIEMLAAHGAFKASGGGVSIGSMTGVKAVCSAPKNDDEPPIIQLEFDFAWQEDAWLFLGRNCSAVADVVLTQRQTVLPFSAEGPAN